MYTRIVKPIRSEIGGEKKKGQDKKYGIPRESGRIRQGRVIEPVDIFFLLFKYPVSGARVCFTYLFGPLRAGRDFPRVGGRGTCPTRTCIATILDIIFIRIKLYTDGVKSLCIFFFFFFFPLPLRIRVCITGVRSSGRKTINGGRRGRSVSRRERRTSNSSKNEKRSL